jgi:oligoendopeptidase F
LILIAAATATARAASSPDTGEAHADLTRYFPNAAAEATDRTAVAARVESLIEALPVAASDPVALEKRLREAETLTTALNRHEVYLRLRYALNHDDRAAADAHREVGSRVGAIRSAVDATMRAIAPSFDRLAAARPALGRWSFLVASARRDTPHALARAEEAITDQLGTMGLDSFSDLYDQTVRVTPFAKLTVGAQQLDVRADYRTLTRSTDRALRRQAFVARLAGYTSHEPLYAALLGDIVRQQSALAKLHHYADAPAQVYDHRWLSRAAVDACIAATRAHADLAQAIDRLRSSRIAQLLHLGRLEDVHAWDLAAQLEVAPPRFTLDQARPLMIAALAPLGRDYRDRFAALLDPARGRADIRKEGRGRERGGFSLGAPGIESALFVGEFIGDLEGITTVIHEGGHAIHTELMTAGSVSPFYDSGPNWLSEAFAILNGLLLRDHLYRTSQDRALKIYYLASLVEQLRFQIFTSAEEAALEEALFDGISAGKVQTGADIDALTARTLAPYSIWVARDPELAHSWMLKRLMFEDPLYYVNYLYAGVLASQLLSRAMHDPVEFTRRYNGLLRAGYSAPPEELLRRAFDIGVPAASAVDDAVQLLHDKVAELEQLYGMK